MKSKLHTPEDLERARFELELHSKLKSPFLVPFLAGEETSESLIIVTPLAQGDLNSMTMNKVLSEDNCRRLCKQLLGGIDYLHGLGLVHGDIKPQNVLLFKSTSSNTYSARLCDFGFTEKVRSEGLLPYRGMRGSFGYFSPEQLRRNDYGTAVDMFALGVIVYTLLSGYEPFYPSNKAGLLTGDEAIDSRVLLFESPYWDSVSAEAKSFIKTLLHGDPTKRATASQALASSWILSTAVSEHTAQDVDIQFE